MKTQDVRWMRIRDLFEQAIEIPAEQRNDFIDRHCKNDTSLRDELKDLLASDSAAADEARSRGPLTGAIGAAVDATTRDRREKLLESRIGPYKLASILGHGGAGTVYLGERIDRQYSAQVAIKIVESAALNSEIGRRFRAERQILANLNHTNIARLIDAGETEQGYPYLVMEYVHGETIDKYCDRLSLNVEERLALILKVCRAVQYAHQNLVVHRDLKPGNILVTPDGTPKLLDFGIAKLLDTGELAAELALTRMNDRLLTPEYASPEQILGQNVTTASDVYSLGVICFELLTGLRPYKISTASQLELERTICVADVSRASTIIRRALVSDPDKPAPTRDIHEIAAARQSTPMRLRARLNGDLDAILARALRKEPVHRYNSVEQFADDLRRHLAREPVLARQGNWVYYTQRFARRHALGVAAGLGFVALLTTALVITSIQAKRIAQERDIATREKQTSEAVAKFMTTVFEKADPYLSNGETVTARELLDSATQSIRQDLTQELPVRARLLEAMGVAYTKQGVPDRGIALIQEALKIRLQREDPSSPNLILTYINLGKALSLHKDSIDARTAFLQGQSLLVKHSKTTSAEFADVLVELGRIEFDLGRPVKAREYYDQALPLLRTIYGPKHEEVGAVLVSVVGTYQYESNFDSALRYAQEAADIYRATLPESNPDRLDAEAQVGELLMALGKADQAAPILEQALLVKQRVFGNQSDRLSSNLNLMVRLRRAQGRLVDAELFARNLLSLRISREGENGINTAYARTTLAAALLEHGNANEAEKELRTALDVYRQKLPPDHLFIASAEHFLIESLLKQNKAGEALSQAEKTVATLKNNNVTPWRIARTENAQGQALMALKKYSLALPLLEESNKILTSSNGPDRDTVRLARARLEAAYVTLHESEKLAALRETERNTIRKSAPTISSTSAVSTNKQ